MAGMSREAGGEVWGRKLKVKTSYYQEAVGLRRMPAMDMT